MITFDELSKIHAELFPETDLKQQARKFLEEKKEMMEATGDERIGELADMIIVASGIARFDYILAIDALFYAYEAFHLDNHDTSDLWQAVEKKVEKLKKRVWVKDPVVGYKHTKGIED